jgi:hypothetical protein
MDGWRHAYICSRDGTEQTLLTPGDYDVIEKVRKTPSFVVFSLHYVCPEPVLAK